jgi:hypothetical protein
MLGKEMADNVQTVGTGKTYATLSLWNAGEGATDPGLGFFNIAECTGDCGTGAAINGAHVQGYKILGATNYDGSNDSALASCSRISLDANNGLIQHFKITNSNGFDNALGIFGANTFAEDVYIDDSSTSSASYGAVNLRGANTNKGMRRFVIKATCAVLIRTGFDSPMILANGVGSGGTSRGILASGANQELTDLFFFDCNANAFSGAFDVESNLASDDATATYTPYTSSELVLFPTNNQTKSTSFLATAGSPFIGAFLEVSAGVSIEVNSTLPSLSSSLSLSKIDNLFSIDVNSTLPSLVSSLSLTNTDNIFDLSVSSELPNLTSVLNLSVVNPGNSSSVNSFLPSLLSSLSLTKIEPAAGVSINSELPSLISSLSLTATNPEFDFSVVSTLPLLSSSLSLYNGVLGISVGDRNNINIVVKSTNISVITKSRNIEEY